MQYLLLGLAALLLFLIAARAYTMANPQALARQLRIGVGVAALTGAGILVLRGMVGYAMSLLFVVQGAPDLALTQFGVETLSVVLFLLVLRQLPDRFERRRPAIGTAVRVAVSAAVGAFIVLMAIATSGSRTQPSVSGQMAEQALPEGHGKNVVNVILVDFRGLDTMGEITVLAAAAIGAVALARVGRRGGRSAGLSPEQAS